jgi:hypothetical protein
MVEHASGGAHDNFGTLSQSSLLLLHIGPADDQRRPNAAPPSELIDDFFNLHRKLSRRRED